MRTVKAADLFCGGGGTSSGLWQACQALGAKLELLAIICESVLKG
jgi:site-specific DNA-cytosine methylase